MATGSEGGIDELAGLIDGYEPSVAIDGESVTVQLPTRGGRAVFVFDDIDAGRKSFDCDLRVRVELPVPGMDGEFTGHLQAASLSNRDQFRLALDKYFSKDFEWTRLLSQAYDMAKKAFLESSVSVPIEDVPLDFENRYRVPGIVPEEGVMIPFGMGDSAKTYQVLSLMLACAAGVPWLERECVPSRVMFMDYEATPTEHRRRWYRLETGAGYQSPQQSFHYLPARGIAFVEQVHTVRRELTRAQANLLVVDSAVAACGGDPLKPEPVKAMFNAMNALRLPVVVIAHATKANESEMPFGTVFWHNLARMTWNVTKVSSEDSPDIQCGWVNKKANNDRRQRAFGVEIRFDDPEGPVSVRGCEPRRIEGLRTKMAATQQIIGAIEDAGKPLDIDDLIERTGEKEKTLYNAANVLVKRHKLVQVVKAGETRRWAIQAGEDVG